MIINLYRHRGYIWRTAWSDVRHRHVGSAMGVVWNILQPLSMIVVFAIIFSEVFQRRDNYVLYLCSAALPWAGFSECVSRGTNAFTANAMYLRKLPIPEQVFVAQSALSSAFSLAISFVLLVIVALVVGKTPTWHWLLIPVPLAMLIALGFGFGLMLGTLNAFIRDVGQVVPILLQVGFWFFPIVYTLETLPRWMQAVIPWNPVYPSMQAIRTLFLDARMPEPALWAGMAGWAVVASALGYAVLLKLRPELRDVI